MAAAAPRKQRTIVPLVIVAIVLLLAEGLVRATASRLPPPLTWSTAEIQVKDAQINARSRAGLTGGVVFLSSSVLDVGLDPAAFAADSGTRLPVYNAAVSGANLEELRWWTDHIVIPELRPRIAVVGVSSREINGNDPQQTMGAHLFFASAAVRHLSHDETVWEVLERYGDDVSYLFRYRKVLRDPDQILHHSTPVQVQKLDFTSPLGQELALSLQHYHNTAAVDSLFQATFLEHFEISPTQVASLAGLIADLQRSGAQVLLVDVPVTQQYIDLHPAGSIDYAAYQLAIGQVAANADIGFMGGQIWNTSYFADPLHLNETGAQRLAGQLATRLAPGLG